MSSKIPVSTPKFLGKLEEPLPIKRWWFNGTGVANYEAMVVVLDRNMVGGEPPVVFTTIEDILPILEKLATGDFPADGWIIENYLSRAFDDYPNYCQKYECV